MLARPRKRRLVVETATERMLRTQDVWALVFEYCGPRDLASTVLVRREWTDTALRVLWRELPSLVPLLKLLGEMTRSNVGKGCWVSDT